MAKNKSNKLFEASLVNTALKQSFIKLNPRVMFRNPVMFTVEICTAVMLAVCLWIMNGEKSQGHYLLMLSALILHRHS